MRSTNSHLIFYKKRNLNKKVCHNTLRGRGGRKSLCETELLHDTHILHFVNNSPPPPYGRGPSRSTTSHAACIQPPPKGPGANGTANPQWQDEGSWLNTVGEILEPPTSLWSSPAVISQPGQLPADTSNKAIHWLGWSPCEPSQNWCPVGKGQEPEHWRTVGATPNLFDTPSPPTQEVV